MYPVLRLIEILMKSLHKAFVDAIPLLERTHLPYLPVDKNIIDRSLSEKVKFWKGLLILLGIGLVMMFVLPSPYGLTGCIGINAWWFVKWNRYLKN